MLSIKQNDNVVLTGNKFISDLEKKKTNKEMEKQKDIYLTTIEEKYYKIFLKQEGKLKNT